MGIGDRIAPNFILPGPFMCGIVGIIGLRDSVPDLAPQLYRMTASLRHRGPDDEGYVLVGPSGVVRCHGADTPWVAVPDVSDISDAPDGDYRLAFGHRRLSIIDLSASGHQPMVYRDRYWIVYNGEIYNFIELREELVRDGYSFDSTSDTEVIMAAYDRWGASCAERFNGMWAFAIYDNQEETLFLSRDHFGMKPLFYYRDATRFVFASEIKAILQCDEVDTGPDLNYCRSFLTQGAREYGAQTAFTNIYRFDTASSLEININDLGTSDLKPRRFWNVTPTNRREAYDPEKAAEYADRYLELLNDSVRLRLRADVRVGSALSGGLDSSSIVYLVNQQLREADRTDQQETFSTVYKSEGVQDCDESAYIDALAAAFNLKTNQLEPRVEDVLGELKKVVYAVDNPSPMPHMGGWYTFLCAANGRIKVTLDGQGADELLGGYLIYVTNFLADARLGSLWRDARAFGALPGMEKKFVLTGIACNLLRRVVGRSAMRSLMIPLLRSVGAKNPALHVMPLNDALHWNMQTELVNLLHYGDALSMAHSVESRLPFLDYRLVEFLISVPAVYKLHDGWTKYIARRAMDNRLPDNITWRRDKMGWPDPLEFWFRGELKEALCREVESSTFLRQLGVGHDIRQRMAGGEPMRILIRLFNLSVWYDTFFGDLAMPSSPPENPWRHEEAVRHRTGADALE